MLSADQIALRLNYICGSDVGTICGVNQYQTPVELWQIKTKRVTPPDINDKPAVMAGNMLEAAVANWFTHVTGKKLREDNKFYVHASIPYLGGNIDRFVIGENALLECKTTQSDAGWGQGFTQGDNKIPDSYLCQVIHYCAVTGCDVAYIAVLIRGIDFRWFKYERNKELEDIIVARACEFWNNHVLADMPPEPQTEQEVISLLHGEVSSDAVYADGPTMEAVIELNNIRKQIKQYEADEMFYRDKICTYLNDRQTLLNTDGTILLTWKQREGSVRFDTKSFRDAHPDLYNQFETKGDPVRTFLLKQTKE